MSSTNDRGARVPGCCDVVCELVNMGECSECDTSECYSSENDESDDDESEDYESEDDESEDDESEDDESDILALRARTLRSNITLELNVPSARCAVEIKV